MAPRSNFAAVDRARAERAARTSQFSDRIARRNPEEVGARQRTRTPRSESSARKR
jgi:hypothetical protein